MLSQIAEVPDPFRTGLTNTLLTGLSQVHLRAAHGWRLQPHGDRVDGAYDAGGRVVDGVRGEQHAGLLHNMSYQV